MVSPSVPSRCLWCNGKDPLVVAAPRNALFRDRTGDSSGRLQVLHFIGMVSGKSFWCCLCACGTPAIVRGNELRPSGTQSCGCFAKERNGAAHRTHGKSRTSLYARWKAMIYRCSDPDDPAFPNYGGRGITVCEPWLTSFEIFAQDMGEPPPGMSLERIDNDKGYDPENCRWATRHEQASNTRHNRWLTYQGETHTLQEWADISGIKLDTIRRRLKLAWDIAAIFETPVHPPRTWFDLVIEAQGETHTLEEWSKIRSLHTKTIICRLQRGWTGERAITTPSQQHHRRAEDRLRGAR